MLVVRIVVIILIVFIIVLGVVAFGLVQYVTKPKRQSVEECIEWQKEHSLWGDFDSYEKEELNIESFDGYLLHGMLLKNPGNRYVIVTHGYTDTRFGSVKYANIYYKLGYNVYIYDLRHHGVNKDFFCSMGYYENQDILAVTDHIRRLYGRDVQIGIHGESLGCASSIIALGKRKDYLFCVADCGFSDLGELLRYQAKRTMNLPPIFADLAAVMCKLLHGYSFRAIRPIDTFRTNETPILFMHGAEDDFIPPKMSQDMYDACKAPKEIHFFAHAKHASSYESAPKEYETIVKEFLAKYVE